MKNKLIVLVLIFSFFVVSLVNAAWVEVSGGQETTSGREEFYGTVIESSKHYNNFEASVNLKEGWNLVQTGTNFDRILPDSELTMNDISVVYAFLPASKQYIQIYPTKQKAQNTITGEIEELKTNAKWIYAKREGVLKIRTYIYYDVIPTYKGWNLIGFNHYHKGLPVSELAGNCNILNIYEYDPDGWKQWDLNYPLDKFGVGKGFAIKVADNCVLKKGATVSAPPTLPS